MIINNKCVLPSIKKIKGSYINLEKISEKDIDELYTCFTNTDNSSWDYLPYGPFENKEDFSSFVTNTFIARDPCMYCVRDNITNEAIGVIGLMQIKIEHRSIEVGHVHFGDKLKGTIGATESVFLLLQHSFSLGYRRFEWKCNNENEKSKKSALRLGFIAEGVFRQHMIVKGKNRDTAWFSMLDSEWIFIENEFIRWLSPSNFDEKGIQKTKLNMLVNNA